MTSAASPLHDMPVLVTGANGFLGRELVSQLLAAGARVRAFVLAGEAVPLAWQGKVEVVRGDVTVPADLEAAADGCRKFFHLAAVVGDSGPDELHQRVSVGGTRNACEVAAARDMQLLLASSIAVYGNRIGRETCRESTPHGLAQGPYGRAKQDQERVLWQYVETRGLDAVIVRPANIYGPGCKPWLYDAGHELKRGMPVLIGGGDFDGALVYVANVASLFVCAAGNPAASRETLLAIDGEGVSWRRYFSDLAVMLRAPRPRSAPRWLLAAIAGPLESLWLRLGLKSRPPLTREAFNLVGNPGLFDNSATRRLLGWAPAVRYDEGMRAVARHVETEGLARR